MKTFKCSFPIDFAFNMSIRCSERTTQPETIYFSVNFLVVIINLYFFVCLYAKKTSIDFACVNPLLFLLLFIIFIVLLPFSINFKFNVCLNFNTMSLFHLNCKTPFGFLPIKEKSLGLVELPLKCKKYGCVLSRSWVNHIFFFFKKRINFFLPRIKCLLYYTSLIGELVLSKSRRNNGNNESIFMNQILVNVKAYHTLT